MSGSFLRASLLFLITVPVALTQTSGRWSPPVALNARTASQSAIALDDSSRATAVWVEKIVTSTTQTTVWSRSRDAKLVWGPAKALGSQKTYPPAILMTAAGDATAVWTYPASIFAAGKPAGADWSAGQNIGSSYYGFQFTANPNGDAAVVWNSGGPPSSYSAVLAVRKPAGGAWGAVETVVSGSSTLAAVTLGQAAMGGNGDLVVSWEVYRWQCPPRGGCGAINYVLQASRQPAGRTAWENSHALTAPEGYHNSLVTVDGAGRAAVVMNRAGTYSAAIQADPGQPWTPGPPLYTANSSKPVGMASSVAGDVTLVILDTGMHHVVAISGNLSSSQWAGPEIVSASDSSATKAAMAVGLNGAAGVVWNGPNLDMRASVRPSSGAPWGAPQSIGRGIGGLPDAITVNASGAAAMSFSTASSVYTSSYAP